MSQLVRGIIDAKAGVPRVTFPAKWRRPSLLCGALSRHCRQRYYWPYRKQSHLNTPHSRSPAERPGLARGGATIKYQPRSGSSNIWKRDMRFSVEPISGREERFSRVGAPENLLRRRGARPIKEMFLKQSVSGFRHRPALQVRQAGRDLARR